VIGVSAVGPSGTKSDYSNYGTEQTSVAAPGGYFRDGFGTDTFQTVGNEILSTYPLKVLQEEKLVDAAGNITPAGAGSVFKDCTAAGVAALIASRYGHRDWRNGGLTMSPDAVEVQLDRTAAEHACPTPRLQSYTNVGRTTEFDAYCAGGKNFNGFYGYGVIDAYAAVGGH
jgi:hypothetical protein